MSRFQRTYPWMLLGGVLGILILVGSDRLIVSSLGGWLLGGFFTLICVGLEIFITCSHAVPHDQVLVIFRKNLSKRGPVSKSGYRLYLEGTHLAWPLLEEVMYLSLCQDSCTIRGLNGRQSDGTLLEATVRLKYRITRDPLRLPRAVDHFRDAKDNDIRREVRVHAEEFLIEHLNRADTAIFERSEEDLAQSLRPWFVEEMNKIGIDLDTMDVSVAKAARSISA